MPYVWSETTLPDGVQFSGWDPYANPPGETVFDWVVVVSPIPVIVLHFLANDRPRDFPYWCVVIPLGLYFLSNWLRTYEFSVSRCGYRLQRFWFGVKWFDRPFSAEALIGLEEDLFEPGVTGIYAGDIHFARGKHAEELLARIKAVVEEMKVGASPTQAPNNE